MSDKNFNEWLFSDIDDLIDCDYSDESEAETRMTDNEIFETEIKCINRRANGKCNGGTDCCKCDLLMNEKDIISAYERAIANSNLINRLQAEIDRLNNNISAMAVTLRNSTKATRNEAIKEFAERLKLSFFNNGYESPDVDFDYFIDNLVKEFVGKE